MNEHSQPRGELQYLLPDILEKIHDACLQICRYDTTLKWPCLSREFNAKYGRRVLFQRSERFRKIFLRQFYRSLREHFSHFQDLLSEEEYDQMLVELANRSSNSLVVFHKNQIHEILLSFPSCLKYQKIADFLLDRKPFSSLTKRGRDNLMQFCRSHYNVSPFDLLNSIAESERSGEEKEKLFIIFHTEFYAEECLREIIGCYRDTCHKFEASAINLLLDLVVKGKVTPSFLKYYLEAAEDMLVDLFVAILYQVMPLDDANRQYIIQIICEMMPDCAEIYAKVRSDETVVEDLYDLGYGFNARIHAVELQFALKSNKVFGEREKWMCLNVAKFPDKLRAVLENVNAEMQNRVLEEILQFWVGELDPDVSFVPDLLAVLLDIFPAEATRIFSSVFEKLSARYGYFYVVKMMRHIIAGASIASPLSLKHAKLMVNYAEAFDRRQFYRTEEALSDHIRVGYYTNSQGAVVFKDSLSVELLCGSFQFNENDRNVRCFNSPFRFSNIRDIVELPTVRERVQRIWKTISCCASKKEIWNFLTYLSGKEAICLLEDEFWEHVNIEFVLEEFLKYRQLGDYSTLQYVPFEGEDRFSKMFYKNRCILRYSVMTQAIAESPEIYSKLIEYLRDGSMECKMLIIYHSLLTRESRPEIFEAIRTIFPECFNIRLLKYYLSIYRQPFDNVRIFLRFLRTIVSEEDWRYYMIQNFGKRFDNTMSRMF